MNKFTKEIIENNPELEKNKDSLNKAVSSLEEINPKIMASSEFKKSLKSRLNGLIGIKQNKKSNFVSFMIPVFSFMFVIGGFFYYFKDINFFDKSGNINETQIAKFSESEIPEINEITNIFEDEIENISADETNSVSNFSIENNNNIPNKKSVRTVLMESDSNNHNEQKDLEESNDNIIDNTPKMMKSSYMGVNNGETNDENKNSVDNQLIDILESVESDIESTFEESMDDETEGVLDDSMIGNSEGIETLIFGDSILEDEEEYNFEQFCEDNSGELSGTGETLKCIKKDLECFASEFKYNSCEFKEKK